MTSPATFVWPLSKFEKTAENAAPTALRRILGARRFVWANQLVGFLTVKENVVP